MMRKEEILKHIKACKLWLDKAQEWIEGNNLFRGLALLFLVQAELKIPLKESIKQDVRTEQVVRRSRILRYAAVYAVAAVFIFGVVLVSYILQTRTQELAKSKVKIAEVINQDSAEKFGEDITKRSLISEESKKLQNLKEIKKEKPIVAKSRATKSLNKDAKTLPEDVELLDLVRTAEETLKGAQ